MLGNASGSPFRNTHPLQKHSETVVNKPDVHYTTILSSGPFSLGFPIEPNLANPKPDFHYTTIWPSGLFSLGFLQHPRASTWPSYGQHVILAAHHSNAIELKPYHCVRLGMLK